MRVESVAEVVVPGPPEAVFDYATNLEHLPRLFRGAGPVPSIEKAEVIGGGEQRVGARRRIHNGDGSVLEEEVLELDRPRSHRYSLYGDFQGLVRFLVRKGGGHWTFEPVEGGHETRVRWAYHFELTSPLALPLALPMMKVAFRAAQRRCLLNLAAAFGA